MIQFLGARAPVAPLGSATVGGGGVRVYIPVHPAPLLREGRDLYQLYTPTFQGKIILIQSVIEDINKTNIK